MIKFALLTAAWFLIAATLVSLVRDERWWVRIFDFPRAQIAGIGVVVAAAWGPWLATSEGHEMVAFAALLGAVAIQGARMYRYTPLAGVQVGDAVDPLPGREIRILISNVLVSNRSERLMDEIRRRDPDIVLAVECDQWWNECLRPLEKTHPYVAREVRDDSYGMAFYSRLEVIDAAIRHLREDYVPSVRATIRLRDGDIVEFHGLHPDPPYPRYAKDTTQRDAEVLLVAREVAESPYPSIVAGDLNDVAWSHTTLLFQKISGMLDPRVGRRPMFTFPARYLLAGFPLDHVFVTRDFRLAGFERLPAVGSDHYPVFIHVSLEPGERFEQPVPAAVEEELEEAEQKIARAERQKAGDPPAPVGETTVASVSVRR